MKMIGAACKRRIFSFSSLLYVTSFSFVRLPLLSGWISQLKKIIIITTIKKGSKIWPFLSSFCILWNTVLQCPKVRKVVTFCLCALLFSATMKLHLRGRVLNPIFTQDCDKTDWKATSGSGLLTSCCWLKKWPLKKTILKRKFLTMLCQLTKSYIYKYFSRPQNNSF